MPSRQGSAVTIGAYDGVHVGHRTVIDDLRRIAAERDLESIVVTFDRHPASVVRPESAPLLLTDLQQRLELLEATGVDAVHLIEFTAERAAESAEDFVETVLVGELAARIVVVGRDFHFGHGRGGNVSLLEKMGDSLGFDVLPFDLVADASGEPVSSTRVRALLTAGDLPGAERLLGRPHEVRGLVAEEVAPFMAPGGQMGGADVQVPANILLPPPGAYRAEAGIVGAALEPCRAVVPPRRREIAVVGRLSAFPQGSLVRVLFGEAQVD